MISFFFIITFDKTKVNTRIIPLENNLVQFPLQSINDPYHQSICGSILLPLPTNSLVDIFAYLRHGKFDRFQRCLEIYYKEIIQMKNQFEQVKFHFYSFIRSFLFPRLFYIF